MEPIDNTAADPESIARKMLVRITQHCLCSPFLSHVSERIRSASRSTNGRASPASASPTFRPALPTTSGSRACCLLKRHPPAYRCGMLPLREHTACLTCCWLQVEPPAFQFSNDSGRTWRAISAGSVSDPLRVSFFTFVCVALFHHVCSALKGPVFTSASPSWQHATFSAASGAAKRLALDPSRKRICGEQCQLI